MASQNQHQTGLALLPGRPFLTQAATVSARETAVLSLLAAYGAEALSRTETAVAAGNLDDRRAAEVRGILADADSAMEAEIHNLPLD